MQTKIRNEAVLRESIDVRSIVRQEGVIPDGMLRDEIDASWRRSLGHGRRLGDGCDTPRTSGSRIYESNRSFIDAATPIMEQLAAQFGHTHGDSLVILANAEATIVAVEGHKALAQRELRDIAPGVCWSEASRGTNALGTALVEVRPMVIDYNEHFLDRLSPFCCTSVPIRDPAGRVQGVLDLTRQGHNRQPHDSLSLLALSASQIESRLFSACYPRQLILAFHPRREYLESSWQGLLAIGADGELLAANEHACALLRQPRETLLGKTVQALLGDEASQLGRLSQGTTASLQSPRGELFYRALQAPLRLLVHEVAQRPPVARERTTDEDRLLALAGGNLRFARSLGMARRGLRNALPIMLQGETGTGKERVAQALHDTSSRADKAFVAVNCAAIPEGLIESELFGYREGAFTGSRRGGMVGRLVQAHGGTLFLDEIGDMPLALQARLLRVLQERKVAPLGGGEEQALDIALICATHRDLKQEVLAQRFREDLYYRVNGLCVQLPPLRERDDLPALCRQLLAGMGGENLRLDNGLNELLAQYHWPGNIRQLEMLLRTAMAMRDEGETLLTLEHLPDCTLDDLRESAPGARQEACGQGAAAIQQALDRHQGDVMAAARALGISRATLYRKLKQ